MNPIRQNQLLFLFAQIGLWLSFFILLSFKLNWWQYSGLFILNIVILHYHLNLVHMASHGLLGKSRVVNAILGNIVSIFGGVTFADFKTTHSIHHAKPTSEEDPDSQIVSNNFLLMPFKIWNHDKFFWTKSLWKKDNNWIGYCLDRLVQIGIVLAFWFSGNILIWQFFWLVPELCVGILNGIFLFYYPHFTTKLELRFRKYLDVQINTYKLPTFAEFSLNLSGRELTQDVKSTNLLVDKNFNTFVKYTIAKFSLEMINVSRLYHEKHHLKPRENMDYYPLEQYLILNFRGLWPKFVEQENLTASYTNIYGDVKTYS